MDDVEVVKAVCALLGGIPDWEWRPAGPAYTADQVAIFYGAIRDTPDRAVGVRLYASTDNPIVPLSTRRVQLRIRGPKNDPSGADTLASAAFTALQGLSRVGGISGISRLSAAPLGADTNGREERTENYLIILDNPEASA